MLFEHIDVNELSNMQMPSLMSLIDNNLRPRNSKPWPQTQSVLEDNVTPLLFGEEEAGQIQCGRAVPIDPTMETELISTETLWGRLHAN